MADAAYSACISFGHAPRAASSDTVLAERHGTSASRAEDSEQQGTYHVNHSFFVPPNSRQPTEPAQGFLTNGVCVAVVTVACDLARNAVVAPGRSLHVRFSDDLERHKTQRREAGGPFAKRNAMTEAPISCMARANVA